MRVLVIGGISLSLWNFRGKMLEAMVAAGHDVTGCAGEVDPAIVERLATIGVKFRGVHLNRRGINFWHDWQYYRSLKSVIREVAPQVVLSYTAKPVVYGSVAAKNCGVPVVSAMVTGAGAAAPGESLKQAVVGHLVRRLYARALRRADVVFFQNGDDELFFQQAGLLGSGRIARIAGSGVDTNHYYIAPPVTQPVTFLLIARLLVNKGLRDFAEAAKGLRHRYGERVRCCLAGPFELGSGGIGADEVNRWCEEGTLEYLGQIADVREIISQASVFVLPSYREGTPRTVLEAMSMQRPIVTTDVPGCREVVIEGHNGFLVPVRHPTALAAAMERFVIDRTLIESMGRHSRQLAESKFDVNLVNRVILNQLNLA